MHACYLTVKCTSQGFNGITVHYNTNMNCIKCKIVDGLPVEGWFKTHRNNVVSCCAACYWLHRIMFLKCSYHSPINLILSYAVPSSLKPTLILSFLLWLCLPSGIFPSGFSTNTLCAFLLCHMVCLSHSLIWFDQLSYISWEVQILKLHIMIFLTVFFYFFYHSCL